MKVQVVSKMEKGILVPFKTAQEIEIEAINITGFSYNKSSRLVGIDKDLYRLSLSSWKVLKKEIEKKGLTNKFDLSKN